MQCIYNHRDYFFAAITAVAYAHLTNFYIELQQLVMFTLSENE